MAGEMIYVGGNGSITAIDRRTGQSAWQVKLPGSWMTKGYVNLLVSGDNIFANSGGKLACLSRKDGTLMWVNDLPGMGYDFCCLATEGSRSQNNPGGAISEAEAHRRSSSSTNT